jgi:flagellar hook-length control protein FliK
MNLIPAACFGLAPRPGGLAPPEAELPVSAPAGDSFDTVLSERDSSAPSGRDAEAISASPTVDDLPSTCESTANEEPIAEVQHEEEPESDDTGVSELAAAVIVAPTVVLAELPPADDTAEKLTAEAEPRIRPAAHGEHVGDQPLDGPSSPVVATDAIAQGIDRPAVPLSPTQERAVHGEGIEAPSPLSAGGMRSAAERKSNANADEAPSREEAAATGTEMIAALESTAATIPESVVGEGVIPIQAAADAALPASFSSAATHSTPHPAHPWPAELLAASERGTSNAEASSADSVRLLHRVARAFVTAQDGTGEVRLRLSPPELGALRLEVKVQGGALIARLETETSAARTTLIENLPALRERLAEQGIRIERFDVDLLPRQGGGQFQRPTDQQPPDQPAVVPRLRRLPQVAEGVIARTVLVGEADLRRLNVIV